MGASVEIPLHSPGRGVICVEQTTVTRNSLLTGGKAPVSHVSLGVGGPPCVVERGRRVACAGVAPPGGQPAGSLAMRLWGRGRQDLQLRVLSYLHLPSSFVHRKRGRERHRSVASPVLPDQDVPWAGNPARSLLVTDDTPTEPPGRGPVTF